MEYDDDSTPEEDAEDARISAERVARGKFTTLEEIERRDAEDDPEEAAFFRRLDKEFRVGSSISAKRRHTLRRARSSTAG